MKNMKLIWTGRILSVLLCCPFIFSAASKLFYESMFPKMAEEMTRMGLPMSILATVAALEIMCIVIYLIPATSVLGAILFTGYLGGAILTHLRIGEKPIMQVVLGMLLWLALCLREPRLWQLLPFRRKS